jgi:hypothetical protein
MKGTAPILAPSTMLRMVPLPRLRGPKPRLEQALIRMLRRAKARRTATWEEPGGVASIWRAPLLSDAGELRLARAK